MLDLWKDPWPLNVGQCPCDVHFTDWIHQQALAGKTVFHFGTGDHHHVGKTLAMDGNDNSVLGITATRPEYDSYIDLVVHEPRIGQRYKVVFTDIYQLEPRLLPSFDIVTLFHLCEFWSTTNAPYATLDDVCLLRTMAAKVRPGGALIFFTGSFAYAAARRLIDAHGAELGLMEPEHFASLLIFRTR